MKAPKISIDSAKLQQVMLLHVEKIVLAVVVLVVIYFVYQGAMLPGLEADKTPDQLTANAQKVTTEINNPIHWEPMKKERVVNHPVSDLVKLGHLANAASGYRPERPWKTPDYPKAINRTDPRLFVAEHVKVVALQGPVAYLPQVTDTDKILEAAALAGGADGEQPNRPNVVQPVRPTPPPRNRPQGEGVRQPPRATRPGREGQGEMMMMQPPGPYGQAGQTGARALPPEAIIGYHGTGEVIAKTGQAVVVMAAVPVEKQMEEFDKAFKDALDYDPLRDMPRYVTFRVERADVTANPEQDPAQATWTALQTTQGLRDMQQWGAPPREAVDPLALDPILTHVVPPFMQRDIYEALVHPDIPRIKLAVNPNSGQPGQPVNPAATAPPIKDDDLLNPTTVQPNGQSGPGEGMRMMQPPGPGGPRMPPGYPAMRGGYGEGMNMQGMNNANQVVVPKYRLLRFTDTTVQPGKKYRYRVKLMLEDPNNPYVGDKAPPWDATRNQPHRKPSIQSLSQNVRTRTEAVKAARYPFLRESDPSEPSEIVELPAVERYFAGTVSPGKGSSLQPGTPPVLSSQATANVLTVTWDQDKAVDVPAEKEVFRGSVLNFEKEVEVIHPSKLAISPIGKHTFATNSIVVDFVGGQEIPTIDGNRRSDNKVQEPSEILLFDGMGNLQLLDETDDVEGFRRYLPPKLEEPKPSTGTTITPEGYPGGLLDGPGPGGPRRPKPGK